MKKFLTKKNELEATDLKSSLFWLQVILDLDIGTFWYTKALEYKKALELMDHFT